MQKLTTVSESLILLCKTRKEELGLTNKTIEEKTGIPESTITKLFNGTIKTPTLETILPICTFLNISVDTMTIINGNTEKQPTPVIQNVSALTPLIDQMNKQLSESYEKQLKSKRESYEKQIKQNTEHYEKQMKLLTDSYERHIKTLIDGYERPLRTKNKWIITLASTVIFMAIALLGAVIYDIMSPDMGWIRTAMERGLYGLDALKSHLFSI